MKTFEDLDFEPHAVSSLYGGHATLELTPEYTISVLEQTYLKIPGKYEIALLQAEELLDDSIITCFSPDEITEVMEKIQKSDPPLSSLEAINFIEEIAGRD